MCSINIGGSYISKMYVHPLGARMYWVWNWCNARGGPYTSASGITRIPGSLLLIFLCISWSCLFLHRSFFFCYHRVVCVDIWISGSFHTTLARRNPQVQHYHIPIRSAHSLWRPWKKKKKTHAPVCSGHTCQCNIQCVNLGNARNFFFQSHLHMWICAEMVQRKQFSSRRYLSSAS